MVFTFVKQEEKCYMMYECFSAFQICVLYVCYGFWCEINLISPLTF